MKYDLRGSTKSMHRMVMEDKSKRESEEKENGIIKIPSSAAGLDTQEYIDKCDVPDAMDDGVARLLYIVAMIVGVIFNGRLFIWIGATMIYLRHVFRRQIHKANWERKHQDK